MHAVVLAGGRGIRLLEHTQSKPKALIKIGDQAILEHIFYHLQQYDVNKITVAGGYEYPILEKEIHQWSTGSLEIEVVDTGLDANTAGRIRRLKNQIGTESFLLCWCDALSDLDLNALRGQHEKSRNLITIAAVNPPSRFGELLFEADKVVGYAEKPEQENRWISGGYFMVNPAVLNHIADDKSSWEYDVLSPLTQLGQVGAYRHHGFWQCMDTIHERNQLEEFWQSGNPPWPCQK